MKTKNLIIIIFIVVSFFIPLKIKALKNMTLNYHFSNELWYTMRGGGKPYSSMQYATYNIDDKTVYCVEPGVQILTTNYIQNIGITSYSDELNERLELIGYYGYDYPKHNTLKFRMATQALIWEEITGQIVEFWTGPSGSGSHISVEREKNEILRLISLHNNKPSFDGVILDIDVLDELEIIDSNNVLNEYVIVENDEFEYRIEDNKLYVKPLVVGNIQIKFEKKQYDESTTMIYRGEDNISQTVASFGISQPVISTINIISYGKIKINKLGEKEKFENNELFYEDVPLEGVEFSLYAFEDIKDDKNDVIFQKNDLIINKLTNNNGEIIFDNLKLGKYIVKETRALQGYIIDENEYVVDIKDKDMIKELVIKNELKKEIVEVPSTGMNNYYISEIISTVFITLGFYVEKVKNQ